jgi:UDP-N-acetylglucosamine 3-dehydrogenase
MLKNKGDMHVGIIGCGAVASKGHIPAYRALKNVKIKAIADIDQGKLNNLSKKYNIKEKYTDYTELLKDPEIDLVSICAPNFLHAKMIIDALSQDKFVIVEKPLCISLKEAKEIYTYCKNNGKDISVIRDLRYLNAIQYLLRLIYTGKIGQLKSLYFMFHYPIPMEWTSSKWYFDKSKSGGGVLADVGEHYLDLLVSIAGKVEALSAFKNCHQSSPDIDFSMGATLKFENNCIGFLDLSWEGASYEQKISIFGTGKTIQIDLWADFLIEYSSKLNFLAEISNSMKKASSIIYKGINRYIFNPLPILISKQIQNILNNLKNSKKIPGNIEESYYIAKIKHLIYESASDNKVKLVNEEK